MSKHVSSVLAAVILTLAVSALAFAQTTTTTVTQTVQNPDGTYTIIEYPAKKEVTLTLNPVTIQGAKGVATILRDDDGTRIKLNLTDVPADVSALTLYAIDDAGVVTALTAYDAKTKIFFRSAVPEGFAVIPVKTNPSGEKVAAVAAPTTTAGGTTYTAPLLNIPTFKSGDDTKIKVDFSGALTGARANVFITPHKDKPTEVKMRFHDLKEAPAGQRFIVWAVGADGAYQKLGEIINTGGRNEAEFKAETALADFGLLVTMESAIGASPAGPAVATIHIVP